MNTGIASINAHNKKYGALKFEQIVKPGKKSKKDSAIFEWYKITLNESKKIITKNSIQYSELKKIMDTYKSDSNIEAVEPNYEVSVNLVPNDPYYSSTGSWGQTFSDMWGLQKINASSAWDQTTGSTSIIVADIDTGVDRNHTDISNNMWINTAEIPNNGIDDDSNGYIDDYYGWDWVNNDNDPMDDNGHGTHTAGTIAAVGNNSIGVVGVSWNGKIMALKFLGSSGSGTNDNGIKALKYAAEMGARISSNSWGCNCNSAAMDDAIQYEHDKGLVPVVAAGNYNADALSFSPASADMAIAAAASDNNDAKASFSNWGEKIDVSAPGVDIISLRAGTTDIYGDGKHIVGTYYYRASGTSMATPHVAGLAALILSKNPSLTNEEVRQIIRGGAVDLGAAGKDSSFGYGRISASGSISLADTRPLSPIITGPRSRTTVSGSALQILGSVPGPNFTSYKVEIGAGRSPGTWIILAASTTQVINGVLATVDATNFTDGAYIFRISATDTGGKTYQFQINDIVIDNFDASITFPVSLAPAGSFSVLGTAQTKNGLQFSNYSLEWGVGSAPTSWSNAGLTLVNNGTQPVVNGMLGTWNTTAFTGGQVYTLRLIVYGNTSTSVQYVTAVKVDKSLVDGWPKLLSGANSIVMADMDGEGIKEVIITADNKIHVFRKDGSNFPGFPASIASNESFQGNANVDDIDGDGKKEIVAASITQIWPWPGVWTSGKIYIIGSNGTFLPDWPTPPYGGKDYSVPTIADLDGDGKKEIITDLGGTVHAYHADGTDLSGFPKTVTPSCGYWATAPLVADLNRDDKPEIAFGCDNRFYLLDNSGNLLPGWPFAAPQYNGRPVTFMSTPASGDIDGDRNLEVLAIPQLNTLGTTYVPLYAWKINGSTLPNWPVPGGYIFKGGHPYYTPSVADIDEDGRDEAIVGLRYVSIFGLNGAEPMTFQISSDEQPAMSDVDGDGKLEFAAAVAGNIQIARPDGSVYWSRAISQTEFVAPVFADLDNNGKMEFGLVGGGVVYLWELPATTTNSASGWPMFSHDTQRTGRIILLHVVNGTVTDGSSPIADVLVSAIGASNAGNTTDSKGEYSLSVAAGNYTVTASKPPKYYDNITSGMVVNAGNRAARNLTLTLRPTGTISGSVINAK